MAHERRPGDRDMFLAQLLQGATVKAAAARAGLSDRAAWRFLADGGRDLLEQMRSDRRRQVVDALAEGAVASTIVLKRTMLDPSQPGGVRVAAAKTLLAESRGWVDTEAREKLVDVADDWVARVHADPSLTAEIALLAHRIEDQRGD